MALALKKIVWGVDAFNEDSHQLQAAAALLNSIHECTGAEIQPIYVLSPGELNLPLEYSGALVDRYLPSAQTALAKILEPLALPPSMLLPQVLTRETHSATQTAETLANFAEDTDSDALVVSTHGRSGMRRLLLGSFAETLLLEARCPVFVIPAGAPPEGRPIRNILFPTELSPRAKAAFTSAVEFARIFHSRLILLHEIPHVIEPLIQSGVYLLGGGWIPPEGLYEDFYNDQSAKKNRKARAWARWAKSQGIETEAIVELGGVMVKDRIVRCAQEQSADLIAMEGHSGRVASALIGSIVRQVVRSAACPIWVLGPKTAPTRVFVPVAA